MYNIEKTSNYKKYVESSFDDEVYLNMFKNTFNLKTKEESIDKHLNMFNEMKEFTFYIINNDIDFIAYFGAEKLNNVNYLSTYFVKKEYRNKEFYSYFLDKCHDMLGNVFGAYRSNRNEKAEKFLIKLGGIKIIDNEFYRLYLFRRSI